jgi:eukaryotic-like serine/threonine-protein kinase
VGVEPGTLIAKRYRVLRPLGKGGMGEVFAAENTRTGRQVALKVLRAEAKAKASAIERFRREARAAGAIRSDYVTQVLDVEDDPEHGIVLVFELLEGESLVDRLKRSGPVPFDELWGIVEAVWMGLSDAHAAGVVHRDLKPSNVYLQRPQAGRAGRVKILDFGISKLPKQITTQSLTQVGQSLGTFSFMPPEQIGKAKSVDHRADIYACTTLIYQAMSGQLPYVAKNVVAMMELKSRTEPRTLGEALGQGVDQRLEDFIGRGLARNPDDRFQTAEEALEAWRRLRPANATSLAEGDSSSSMDDDDDDASRAKTEVRNYRVLTQQAASGRGGDPVVAAVRRYFAPTSDGGLPRPAPPGEPSAGQQDGGHPPLDSPSYGQPSAAMGGPAGYGPGAERGSPAGYGPAAGGPMTAPHTQEDMPTAPRPGLVPSAAPPQGLDPRRATGPGIYAPPNAAPGFGAPPTATGDARGSYYHLEQPGQALGRGRTESGSLKMALLLVLGAVGLMLLGFGIVALAMRLLQ